MRFLRSTQRYGTEGMDQRPNDHQKPDMVPRDLPDSAPCPVCHWFHFIDHCAEGECECDELI